MPPPEHYPTFVIDTTAKSTGTSNDVTGATVIQTTVNSALEARDAVKKKSQLRANPTQANPTPANSKQTCRYCKKAVQTLIHTRIAEENCFLNPAAIQYRPNWARKISEGKGIAFKML